MKRWGFFVFAPLILIGCVVESSRSGPSGSSSGSGSSGTGSTGTSKGPILVVVDADKTMNVVGGDGVGVFIEYKRGGQWHVTWTCDTAHTNQTCNFDIKLSANAAIANVRPDKLLASDQQMQNADGSIRITANTGSNIAGVFFDTPAGAQITVDAGVAGISKTGDYLFFVQDGLVNGNYSGVISNPLMLEPSSP
jgi:hypothetical protein